MVHDFSFRACLVWCCANLVRHFSEVVVLFSIVNVVMDEVEYDVGF